MGRYDRFAIVRVLAESDLGWFAALRPRVKSKQRAININGVVIQRILPQRLRESTRFDVTAECVMPGARATETRVLSRVHKNWRLGGTAVKGDVFARVAAGDFLVAEFDGAVGPLPTLRWSVVTQANAVECEMIRAALDHQLQDGMASFRGDAAEYRVVSSLLDSHREQVVQPGPLTTASDMTDQTAHANPSLPTTENVPPDPGRMIQALRSMGYTFEQAVADLVDNSLAAKAKRILVRVMRDEDSITRVFIADDGRGMSEDRLTEAMRFGSAHEQSTSQLGKFGMGLKLASLSHAPRFAVATRRGGWIGGRQWTIEGITRGWECDILSHRETGQLLKQVSDALDTSNSGTVVCWYQPDRISIKDKPTVVIDRLIHRLRQHLAIHLHRFIEDGRVHIELDSQEEGTEPHAVRTEVEAQNPFRYDASPDDSFPRQYRMELAGIGPMKLEAHIWPPDSTSPNYKLDNRVSARQGFYIYRNDRLIQAGGWNNIRETEPHLSLARVAIDLSPAYDQEFGLDVQKSSVELPPGFPAALQDAKDDEGRPFREFLQRAQAIYRKQERANPENQPLVPGTGIAAALRQAVKDILVTERRRTRPVEFEWTRISPEELFALDRDNGRILLNKEWRHRILDGRRASSADAPLLKLLLFLLVRDDLDTDRVSRVRKERLDQINRILLAALRPTANSED